MKRKQPSKPTFNSLALSVVTAGFMFTSAAHAFVTSEAHVCAADSAMGYGTVGEAYYPGARSARTYLYEMTFEPTTLIVDLWAYPEGSPNTVHSSDTTTVAAGWFYGSAGTMELNPATAPGALLSAHTVWRPSMTRSVSTGHYIGPNETLGENGCISQLEQML